jgi:glutamyl-Q tRNA(Asp) synthetase
VQIGGGVEAFDDVLLGPQTEEPSPFGDLVLRDRERNWTYGFAVVVDDLRHGIDLVVRGEDLLPETARQVRLARLLGRDEPARFLHHALIRKPSGAKLSKSDGDSGVRDLRSAGWTASGVRAEAARLAAVPARIVEAAATAR